MKHFNCSSFICRSLFLIVIIFVFTSTMFSQWQTIFSDDFNRVDGPLVSPWMVVSQPLAINSQKVYGNSSQYGLEVYVSENDSAQSVRLTVNFNFANDTNGRYQFMIGTAVQNNFSGYIAKISDSTVSLWSLVPPDVLMLPAYNYSFQPNVTYTAILENNASIDEVRITIKNSVGTTLLSLGASSTKRYYNGIAIGTDNDNTSAKFIDDVVYDRNTTTGVNNKINPYTPSRFILSQNFPNPFNPTTNISFRLPSSTFVSLKVFDLLGKEIATLVSERMSAGDHSRQWNAMNMPSGVYFYRLQAGSLNETKKLVLLR